MALIYDLQTPRCILDPLGRPFDLDPYAPVIPLWDTADTCYTREDDGLAKPWKGFVWLHPPRGRKSEPWLDKLGKHKEGGIALIPATVHTKIFEEMVWSRATTLLFIGGKVLFYHEKGGTYSNIALVLVAYGEEASFRMNNSGIPGSLVSGWLTVQTPNHDGKEWVISDI